MEVKSAGTLGLWFRLGLWEVREGESEDCENVESRLLLLASNAYSVSSVNEKKAHSNGYNGNKIVLTVQCNVPCGFGPSERGERERRE
jgi:hypothetical protein